MLHRDIDLLKWIQDNNVITPFEVVQKRCTAQGNPAMSWGLGPGGYDVRLGYEFSVPDNGILQRILRRFWPWLYRLDPKNRLATNWQPVTVVYGKTFILPPYSFALGTTIERFKIPTNYIGLSVGKSSIIRAGLLAVISPLEPGWEGFLTIELFNPTSHPIVLYPGEGITQILFFPLDGHCIRPYTGPYQGQSQRPYPSRVTH